ncbi:hypothetical protein Fleli_2962 [Bernardetia litoralis DSM 6794]|uniref:Uncharacterized protein n=1 Tax=Bernardetia litoralis (strain ATCC 23117 / DSM 6794 / NBRC 15988 / NCIMB 1366 / Fx l1 / Sio-4) TaxID=880071 RepID=I4AMX2_BERLS|nr:hypothetical protein [Bernardetia litoralis]AFM05307.1 hypothetical protein Fleli_2962 [Bernardetia litoralis DSM 6794]
MTNKIGNQFSLKLLIVGIIFLFNSCVTPTNTEKATETDSNKEIQQAVNKEANSEQENVEYAEKQEATNQAIALYEFLKNGLYENTSQLVDKENYPNFSETNWLEFIKKEALKKGQVEKYALQTSKIETLENGNKIVKMIFEVTRTTKKYKEEVEFLKLNGKDAYLLNEIEFENSHTEEDDD